MEEAAAGDAFLICKAGKPMVCVTPIDQHTSPKPLPRRLGLLEGQCSVPDDFDHLDSEAIADLFEGA
jgi:antitoxin (DNA-binding transcriptional repressor) of toxin-antitoxin stability system